MTRIMRVAAVLVWVAGVGGDVCWGAAGNAGPIDRQALVRRHNVELDAYDKATPLQVGNGHFAFAVDVTGLQTFSAATLSDWGWYTAPNPENYRPEETMIEVTGGGGHKAFYASKGKHYWTKLPAEEARRAEGAWNYFRANPGRLPLGSVRFQIFKKDGKRIGVTDVQKVRQTLDLWSGTVTSCYEIEGVPVDVTTCCHPELDAVAVRVKSGLIAEGRLKVALELPAIGVERESVATPQGAGRVDIAHRIDSCRYFVAVAWSDGTWTESAVKPKVSGQYLLTPAAGRGEFGFLCAFAPKAIGALPGSDETAKAAAKHWQAFWLSGGAIDLSESKDPRWRELERRIVLSQYLTAVNSTGNSPPQESGLYSNSWYGKYHLEMTAWHGIHFALWGRSQLVDGWMKWMLGPGMEAARRQAVRQGYKGVRWMKMIAPTAEWESPSNAGPFRMTQQGHAIYWAEEMYRAKPTRETLERFKELVQQSAEFMVDYLWWDGQTSRYVLGPPLLTGSEATDHLKSFNSTVELSYWFYGLRVAQQWRERLGLAREAKWDEVLAKLSKPPVVGGLCRDAENVDLPSATRPTAKGKFLARPAWCEAYGCMRGDEVDREAMARTFDKIWKESNDGCQWMFWGCDFPMMAMTAARLGRPKEAVEALVHPGNKYLANGFCNLGSTPYLPASGGLLWTVAMMAAGWDGCPERHAPGFPDDGSWVVKCEGLRKSQ